MLINKYMTPQVPLNIKRARFYSQNSKYAEAIAQYQKSIIQPGDREEKIIAFNEEGMIYLDQGKFAEALTDFNKGLNVVQRLKKADSSAGISNKKYHHNVSLEYLEAALYYHIGSVYMGMRRLDEALINFDKAIELSPTMVDAYQNKAVVFRLKGDYAASIKACEDTLAVDINFGKAYCSMGWAYGLMGDYKQEVQCQKEAIKRWPKFVFAYYRIGLAYEKLGEDRKAIEVFQEALRISPNYQDVREELKKLHTKRADKIIK